MVMREVEVIAEVRVMVSGIRGTDDPSVLLIGCGVRTVTTGVPETRDRNSVTVVTVVLPPMKAVKVSVITEGTAVGDDVAGPSLWPPG
jgi:hypothetical protein